MPTSTVPARTTKPETAELGGPPGRPPASGPVGPAGRRPRPGGPAAGARAGRSAPVRQPGAAARALSVAQRNPDTLAHAFAHLYLEVESGRRPAQQLARLMDPVLHARLESCWVRLGRPPGTVRRVRTTMVHGNRIDAVAVVQRGRRAGAIMLTMHRLDGRWCVTYAARPEDGPLPPPPFPVCPAGEVDGGLTAGVSYTLGVGGVSRLGY